MGQTMRGEITVDMDYSEKALSQDEKTTRVETELLGGKSEVSFAGQQQTTDMPTGRMVADLDARGRIVKLIESDLPGADQQQLMAQGGESFPNWSQFSAFPEGDVKEGDSWSGTVEVPMGVDMPKIEMSFTSKLLALTTFQDRKCAKLQTTFSAPVDLDMSQLGVPGGDSGDGSVSATLSGNILWYYDHESSVYVYGEGTVGMDMTMSMAMPNMPSGTMTMKMLMNMKTTLVP